MVTQPQSGDFCHSICVTRDNKSGSNKGDSRTEAAGRWVTPAISPHLHTCAGGRKEGCSVAWLDNSKNWTFP